MISKTASDMLRLALAEPESEKRFALLEEAESLALASTTMRNADLLSIASCYVDAKSFPAAKRCIEHVLGDARGEIWSYRNSAKLYIRMDELDSARVALDACAEAFTARDTKGYEWRLLAAGWADDLGDLDGVIHCLARATLGAKTSDDHCSLATGLYELASDLEGAHQALKRAAEAAEHGKNPHNWWTIANAYSAIEDREGVAASLERGTELANSVDAYLTMASAWQSQIPKGEGFMRSLTSARRCAESSDEWLRVAEAYFDYQVDASALRDALEEALKVALEPSHHRRVAQGFRDFLGDDARANSIAPAGLSPNEIAVGASLSDWEGDAASLLNYLRPQLTPQILQSIADADYGMDSAKNMKVLEGIVSTGLVPHPLEWIPLEVLQLTRWSEGASVDHIERAFACTLLCIEGASGMGECSEADVIILLESCAELGADAMRGALALMVALVEGSAFREEGEAPQLWFPAVFGQFLAAGHLDPADPRLAELAEVAMLAERMASEGRDEFFVYGMRAKAWQRFADSVLLQVVEAQPHSALAELLRAWSSCVG